MSDDWIRCAAERIGGVFGPTDDRRAGMIEFAERVIREESATAETLSAAANLRERVAQLTAHRACISQEHDPANGKCHGSCVVCGVDWPCETAKVKP